MTDKRTGNHFPNDDISLWGLMKTYKWLTTYIALVVTVQLIVVLLTH